MRDSEKNIYRPIRLPLRYAGGKGVTPMDRICILAVQLRKLHGPESDLRVLPLTRQPAAEAQILEFTETGLH